MRCDRTGGRVGILQAIERGIARFDFEGLAKRAISDGIDHARGPHEVIGLTFPLN